ncbi:MAG: stage II sporulation protein M [Acidobacteria bacterium]|nr:stage II sporulation protein M [Acidobacteriota bacterium]
MLSNLWINSRKHNWNRLDVLVRQVESTGIKSLPTSEIRELGILYRQTAADLSAIQADPSSRTLAQYLNRLVSRAHNYVYSGRRISLSSLWRFFAFAYPRLLRRLSGYLLAATLISVAAGLLGSLIVMVRPSFGVMFLGAQRVADLDHHKMWTDSVLSIKPEAASGIMTNNITVCFLTFAGGITAGLFTLYSLFNNGLMLGAIAVVCRQHHMALSLWSFVAAHGALELPSIMIAGAAGLRLASGLLFPGMLHRRAALALAGLESVQLVAGTIPLLIIAGTLEAFLSPTHAPIALKFAVGAILLTALTLWLTEAGRTRTPKTP